MKRSEVIPLIKEHGKGKGVDSEILPTLIVEEILRHDKLQSKDVDMKELTQTVRKFLNKFWEKLNKCNKTGFSARQRIG